MSVHVGVFAENPTVTFNTALPDEPFAVVELSPSPGRVSVHVHTEGEADGLIAAFTEAKRLLATGGAP